MERGGAAVESGTILMIPETIQIVGRGGEGGEPKAEEHESRERGSRKDFHHVHLQPSGLQSGHAPLHEQEVGAEAEQNQPVHRKDGGSRENRYKPTSSNAAK